MKSHSIKNVAQLITAVLFGMSCSTPADEPTTSDASKDLIQLGETEITLVRHQESNGDVLFINVHENEATSIYALQKFNKSHPINYIYLEHSGDRRIEYLIEKDTFSVDPNRIYTSAGRDSTLVQGGNTSNAAKKELKKFADKFLENINGARYIIAMHNNTDSNYSILSYFPGGDEAQNTQKVFSNFEMDPDDFIYTTDLEIFEKLKERDINVILQDNSNFVDDGSLSVYCGKRGIKYINIETEHGHLKEQLEFMQLIYKMINS